MAFGIRPSDFFRSLRISDFGFHSVIRHWAFVIAALFAFHAAATPVLFPLAQMFGGTNYTKPFTLTAQLPAITDGANVYVGTYQIVTPAGGTNPVVNLTPNNYLLSFTDSQLALRFGVPNSAATLNVLNLITNGLTTFSNWSGGLGGGFALGAPVGGSNSQAGAWMLVMAPDGTAATNPVPVSGASTSSNNFVGSLNAGQVYGLGGAAFSAVGAFDPASAARNATNGLPNGAFTTVGSVAALGSNTLVGMAGAAVAGSNYLTSVNSNTFSGSLNLGQVYGLGTVAGLGSNQVIGMAIANVSGGAATNAIAPNGGTGANIALTQTTTVDAPPVPYATPTFALFYGDSITQGNYVTNGYCADLAAMGFHRFTVEDFGISSSHLTDVSNLFWGSSYSGSRSYTNWLGHAGSNYWVSFWIGINDCLYDGTPIDTNTWIASYTNMWWTAHQAGASPVVVFTIEDSLQLSASGETNRALLNSLITQAAAADNAWVVLLNNDLILPSTNATYFLYNPSANYGLHPTDYGHSLVAQALASQVVLGTNLARGAYFNGPVWSATGFGGNGSNLLNVPVTLGNAVNGTNTAAAVGMLGVDAAGRVTSNAVPAGGGGTSSNNFAGSLNFGQVYGLGNAATLSSNQVIGMATTANTLQTNGAGNAAATKFTAGAAVVTPSLSLGLGACMLTNAGGFYVFGDALTANSGEVLAFDPAYGRWLSGVENGGVFTTNEIVDDGAGNLTIRGKYTGNGAGLSNTLGSIVTAGANVTVTSSTNAGTGQVTYSVATSGGGATLPGTLTNINLARTTTVDQSPTLYATPTWGVLYGDTLTHGDYTTNDYAGDLLNLGWQHFGVTNFAASSSKLADVSNAFWGTISAYACYTNWMGLPGTNAWVAFWIGVNDCNTSPLDTNTWIKTYTNLWWTAHTNGAYPVVALTIADSMQLTAAGETNRAALNNLILQNAQTDAAWVTPLNTDLILGGTNGGNYLFNASAGYGVLVNDAGHSLLAQALASQLELATNLARGAYFNGPVWSSAGFAGSGSNLFNLPAGKLSGTVPAVNLAANTVVSAGSGVTVASNSAAGVQTYTVSVGSIAATPAFLSQRVWAYMPNGSGATLSGFGQSGSTSGTFAGVAESATDPYCIVASTSATPGNNSTLGDNQKTIAAGKPLMLVWRMGLATNTANIRVWMAVSDYATIAAGDVSRNCLGFLYSSTNGPDWQLATQMSGAHQWTDTGIVADTNSHTFEISYDGSANVYGYIDNVCVATNTSDLLTGIGWGQWLTVTALTNTPVGVRFMQFYGQQGF